MDHPPSQSALETSAAMLGRIWGEMFRRFGLFGVQPALQMATVNWCSTKFRQFGALLARYQAGKLRICTTPRVVTPGRKIVNKLGVRMTRKWGWLVLTGKHHAAGYGSQIQHVLVQPEMAELLEYSAQARRIMRPLCRALSVELPWTVDKPRAVRPHMPRKPRPKPKPFRIPLPRGVLAWARRDRALDKAIKARDALVVQMAQARGR
jgi:hypothetical protein